MMLIGIYIAMAVAAYFDNSLLLILVLGAASQCIIAFSLSRNIVYLKLAASLAVIATAPHISHAVAPSHVFSEVLNARLGDLALADLVTCVMGMCTLFVATFGGLFLHHKPESFKNIRRAE